MVRGFIQKEQVRLRCQGSPQRDTALLTTGERRHEMIQRRRAECSRLRFNARFEIPAIRVLDFL